jgi:exodeoxyribonuclease X
MKEKLIFLDTEATGNEPKTDRLCQVCYQVGEEIKSCYFKPPIPISIKAMSITHITNKMVEGKEAFADSRFKKELQALLDEGILVAHTALFDIAMLKNEGIEVPRFIDTLRVVRYLDPENKIPEHNLQYLRYFLELEVPGTAHDAEGDVNVLVALFDRLFKKVRENCESDEDAIEKMVEISARPTLFKYMLFGKYKGQSLEEVCKSDRRYLEWLLSQKTAVDADTDEDWIYTLKHHLGR